MAKAKKIFHEKHINEDGSIIEMKIWALPKSDDERPHGLKYSLYFGKDGQRIVAYDNESGKGDHKHIRNKEMKYKFIDVEKLIEDFISDIKDSSEFN